MLDCHFVAPITLLYICITLALGEERIHTERIRKEWHLRQIGHFSPQICLSWQSRTTYTHNNQLNIKWHFRANEIMLKNVLCTQKNANYADSQCVCEKIEYEKEWWHFSRTLNFTSRRRSLSTLHFSQIDEKELWKGFTSLFFIQAWQWLHLPTVEWPSSKQQLNHSLNYYPSLYLDIWSVYVVIHRCECPFPYHHLRKHSLAMHILSHHHI